MDYSKITVKLGFAMLLAGFVGAEAQAGGDHDHDHDHEKKDHDHDHSHDHDHGKRHHGAHVHGVGQLKIVVVENDIQLSMTVPGADIVGYEHAAKSKSDKSKAATAKKLLSDASILYSIDNSAECKMQSSDKGSVMVAKKAHADWDTNHMFECAKRPAYVDLAIFDLELPSKKAAELSVSYEVAVTSGGPVENPAGKLSKEKRRVSLR